MTGGLLLKHALALANAGLAVFPVYGITAPGQCACGRRSCPNAGKHPWTKRGFKAASTDVEQIGVWWKVRPEPNIGIATGGGLLVLDEDPRHGGTESLRALVQRLGSLPPTPTVRTGSGGAHYYFSTSSPIASRIGVLAGIDVKCEGGYVVAPPSVHASGQAYEWLPGLSLADIQPAPVPDWLLAELARRPTRERARSVSEGGRNNYLASVGGRLRRNGAGSDELRMALLQENARACVPPLSEDEVHKVADSVARYPSGGVTVSEASRYPA